VINLPPFTKHDFFGVLYLINKASYYFKGRTRLQKMIMLATREDKIKYPFSFEFVRYHYGPFSFPLQDMISDLIRAGILEEQQIMGPVGIESLYRLTDEGQRFLDRLKKEIPNDDKKKLDEIWEKYRFLSKDALVIKAKEIFGW